MKRAGFALVEMMLVIGIIGVLSGLSVPLYRDYQIRTDLNLATEQVSQGLARARLLAESGQNDAGWGFYIPAGTLYKGTSYADRDPAFDEIYPMPSTITPTGLLDISYAEVTGKPSTTGSILLTTLNEEQRTITITVEKESVTLVENDTLTICHFPPGQEWNLQTIRIPDNAWPAHQAHGDVMGPCVGESSAISSASSISSAASSSSTEGSEGGETSSAVSSSTGGGATCEDRFSVAEDGTITTTGPLSIRFRSLGAQFGYGNGGPIVPVTVAYKQQNRNRWTQLFGGSAINGSGGAEEVVASFEDGDSVIVKFRAYFHQRGWLTYDRTIYSNDGSDAILVLRNGDPAPQIPGANGQMGVALLLQSITQNGIVNIGEYDLALIGDFNRLDCRRCTTEYCTNCSGVDYQDGVLLVQFLPPSC